MDEKTDETEFETKYPGGKSGSLAWESAVERSSTFGWCIMLGLLALADSRRSLASTLVSSKLTQQRLGTITTVQARVV